MKPTQVLPSSYIHCYTLDSGQHKIAQILLVCVGLGAFFLCWQILEFLSPSFTATLKLGKGLSHIIPFLITIVVMILLHETIHAFALWRFTGTIPSLGISRMGSVYVNASAWYLPRIPMLVMSLSPIFMLSIAGTMFLGVASGELFKMLLWAILLNAVGAVNDLAVAAWVFFQPATVLIKNSGQALSIYRESDSQTQKPGIKDRVRGVMERYLLRIP